MLIGPEILRIEKAHLVLVFYLFIGDCLVAWLSKKQNSISLSTTEDKYIAIRSCCTQLLWMKQVLKDYGIEQGTMCIHYDNFSDINISKNPVLHSRTENFEIHHHFIRDFVEGKVVSLEFVPIEHQLVDILNNPWILLGLSILGNPWAYA